MIKFKAIIKRTLREFEPHMVYSDYSAAECDHPGHVKHYLCDEIILVMGVEIGGEWHYENDVYYMAGSYYSLCSGIDGWILNSINLGMPINVGHIATLKKIGHLWSPDEKLREIVTRHDPLVFSLLEMIGKFSEVME